MKNKKVNTLVEYIEQHLKKTVYIAGGIAGLNPKEVEKRFLVYQERLEALGLKVLSPIRGKVLDTEVGQKYEPREIVDRDLNDINNADFIIAQPSPKSIGTIFEIYHARAICHIPVIVVAVNEEIARHYWIRYFATKVVYSMDEAIEYLQDWFLKE